MGWRINTRAEAGDSRHFHSGWNPEDSGLDPAEDYTEEEPWGFVVWLTCGIGLVCAVAWAIKEVLQ